MSNNKKELTARDLALFLGCEIEWMGERGYTLTGINTGDEYINPVGLKKGEYHYWANIENVRPVLRPFSDMTPDERFAMSDFENQPGASFRTYEALRTQYALSRGFDVFDWIPAGLAVDATEKEVEP